MILPFIICSHCRTPTVPTQLLGKHKDTAASLILPCTGDISVHFFVHALWRWPMIVAACLLSCIGGTSGRCARARGTWNTTRIGNYHTGPAHQEKFKHINTFPVIMRTDETRVVTLYLCSARFGLCIPRDVKRLHWGHGLVLESSWLNSKK